MSWIAAFKTYTYCQRSELRLGSRRQGSRCMLCAHSFAKKSQPVPSEQGSNCWNGLPISPVTSRQCESFCSTASSRSMLCRWRIFERRRRFTRSGGLRSAGKLARNENRFAECSEISEGENRDAE